MRHTSKDITRARRAVQWDSETDESLVDECFEDDEFVGEYDELFAIRQAMRRYEKQEADIGEDKAMYDSRYALQFALE